MPPLCPPRPEEIEKRKARAMWFFTEVRGLSTAQAEEAMRQHPESFEGIQESQQIWDKMFCNRNPRRSTGANPAAA